MDTGDFFMSKISFSGSKNLLFNFLIRSLLLSALTTLAFSALFSIVGLKIDLDEKYLEYISVIITSFSSIIISYFSVKPFKNNGFAVGMISVSPLIIYSLINLIVCKNSVVFFLIKIVVMLILGGIFGAYSTKHRKKIRVK